MPGASDKWWHAPGVPVFPVKVSPRAGGGFDKRPMTPNGHKDAKDFADWEWKVWLDQGCNAVGIVMGSPSGLYALDVDSYKGGGQWEGWLDQWVPDWHETLQHATPSGGRHLIFRTNGAGSAPTRASIVQGLDARGEGGWIAVGEGYEVVQRVPPRELPDTALEELRRGSRGKGASGKTPLIPLPNDVGLDQQIRLEEIIAENVDLSQALDPKSVFNTTGEGQDRSKGLYRLACACVRLGLSGTDFADLVALHPDSPAHGHVIGHSSGAAYALGHTWQNASMDEVETPRSDARDAFGKGPSTDEGVDPSVEDILPGDGTPQLPPLVPETVADIIKNFQPMDYLIEDVLAAGAVTMLVSPPNQGKTAITMEIARCVATGVQFGGHDVDTPGRFLYLIGEDRRGWNKRIIALWEKWGFDPALFDVEVIDRATIADLSTDNRLDRLIQSGRHVGVAVDTLSSWFDGDNESDNVQAQAFMRRLEGWANAGLGVLVDAHPTKDAKTGLTRGASAFTAAAHTNLVLKDFVRVDGVPDVAGVVKLHWDLKIRGDDFLPICFKLEKVVLKTYQTKKGKQIKSVVAVHIPFAEYQRLALTAVTAVGLTPDERAFLQALHASPGASIRSLAKTLDMHEATLRGRRDKLAGRGFILDGKLTEKGLAAVSERHGFDDLDDPF